MEQQGSTIEVFCCYAHEDEHLLYELKIHLSPLQRQQLVDIWHDRDISAGAEWEQEIEKHLNKAHIILLLISPDFISSEYCYGIEMKRALELHKRGEARVIPVILRPVGGWEKVPPGDIQLGQLQALPKDAKPVISWTNRDEAWKEVAEGIERVINELLRKSLMTQSTLPYDSLASASIQKHVDQLPSIPDSGVSIPHASAQQKSMSPTEFYSCFISYSSYDQDVAERLYTDLQGKGVRCWFAPHHMKIGDKIRSRIDESIRTYDKLLLIFSKHSVASQWVETEVETAFEQERQQNKLVLFSVRIDETVMQTKQSWAADIRRTRHIGDFTHWKDRSSYDQVFTRLLHDLETEPFPGNMENGDEDVLTPRTRKQGATPYVFISYSYRDQPFALQLVGALAQRGYTPWFDKNDVFPAGEFWEDIKAGIEEAGAFIFILSPDSLDSQACLRELNYAQACGKKLIPLLYRDINPSRIPQSLQELDWIEDISFDHMLEKILDALQIDKDDWKQAGRWLRSGSEWQKNRKQNSGLLLHGKELKKAEEWLKRAERGHDKKPQPLPLHIRFIRESRRVAKRAFLARIIIIILVLFVGLTAGGAFVLFVR